MKITCCFNCPERHIGCHAFCEKYLKEKREHDKARQAESEQKKVDHYFNIQRKIKTVFEK